MGARKKKAHNVPIAIKRKDFIDYGCPDCGHFKADKKMSGKDADFLECDSCNFGFVIIEEWATQSDIGFGSPEVFPTLIEHPRAGE